MRMVDDENAYLRQVCGEELARAVEQANDEEAVVLLLRGHSRIQAIMLWRNRTGADLRTAVYAVADIERRHGLSTENA